MDGEMMERAELGTKEEFLSPAWFVNLRRLLSEAVARRRQQLLDVDFSLCEVFTDCPDAGQTAHWFRVTAGELEWGDGAFEADSTVVVDHATCVPLSRTRHGPVLDNLVAQAKQREAFHRVERRPMPGPLSAVLDGVHDAMADLTA